MNHRVYYAAEDSDALRFALDYLALSGGRIATTPTPAVTDVLLGVPCRIAPEELRNALKDIPNGVRVYGGFLNREELQNHHCYDLLQQEGYLAKNAAITAHCALQLTAQRLPVTLEGCPALVIGWGRIGKILAKLLHATGADVTVAVRRESQRAMLEALGYTAIPLPLEEYLLPQFRVIFNTVPAPVLSRRALSCCRPDCIKLELASKDGFDGEDILIARGLPGKMAPESSGKLIARTVMRLGNRKEEDL